MEADGVKFYADASPGGVPGGNTNRELKDGNAKSFPFSRMQHIVQRMRKATSKVDYV